MGFVVNGLCTAYLHFRINVNDFLKVHICDINMWGIGMHKLLKYKSFFIHERMQIVQIWQPNYQLDNGTYKHKIIQDIECVRKLFVNVHASIQLIILKQALYIITLLYFNLWKQRVIIYLQTRTVGHDNHHCVVKLPFYCLVLSHALQFLYQVSISITSIQQSNYTRKHQIVLRIR